MSDDDKVMQAGDDPADFTVEQVNKYLHDDDLTVGEFRRVIKAEQDGKARVGIVGDGDDDTEPGSVGTADAVIVQRIGSVNQAEADADAKRRNAELVEQGTNSDRGYVGSDAGDLQRG